MKLLVRFLYISMVLYHIVRLVSSSCAKPPSYIKIEKGHHAINESIIDRTFTAISLPQCSYRCTNHPSWSLYFVRENETCHCNKAESNRTYEDPVDNGVTYGYFYGDDKLPRFKDCLEIYEAGFRQDGVYKIKPECQSAVDAWCDLSNGGWTVIQRRQDGSVDFYRGWTDYVTGFANKSGEYWLGLDNIHALTTEPTELHIYMDSFGELTPPTATTRVASVKVEGPSQLYRLHFNESRASCGVNNLGQGARFSTHDNDNDPSSNNCAILNAGAWWYTKCGNYNLNTVYANGGVTYAPCWNSSRIPLAIMKVRRTDTHK